MWIRKVYLSYIIINNYLVTFIVHKFKKSLILIIFSLSFVFFDYVNSRLSFTTYFLNKKNNCLQYFRGRWGSTSSSTQS